MLDKNHDNFIALATSLYMNHLSVCLLSDFQQLGRSSKQLFLEYDWQDDLQNITDSGVLLKLSYNFMSESTQSEELNRQDYCYKKNTYIKEWRKNILMIIQIIVGYRYYHIVIS